MPSGPKKRRAAKKKKKLEGNNNNSNNSHSHGKEDLIDCGHKETDDGEVSSSVSQDHQFNDREETGEKQLEISHSESSIDKNKSNALRSGSNEAEKVAIEGGGNIHVERELKLEGESMSHNIKVECVEPVRFPHEGGLRRRSSGSSKPAMSVDIVQVATSASDIDIVVLHSIGSSEKENEKRELGVMDEKTRASYVVVDTGLEKRDNRAVETSDTKISAALKDDDKVDLSYDAPAAMSHNINVEHVEPARFPHEGGLRRRSSGSSKPAMSEDIVQVATSSSDIDIVALHPIGSSEKENEKRELGVMDEKTRVSDVVVDMELEKRDNKAVETSDTKISVALKDDDKVDLSYDAPAAMSHNIKVERVEPARFPYEGGLRRRSSSSSKPAVSEDRVQVATSSSDIDIVALHPIGLSEKENEKRELSVMDEKTRALDVVVDTELEKRDNKAVETSDTKISVALKDEDKLDLSYDAPAVDASDHADDVNGSPHDHQPLVALVPPPAQTTSWKSCCGLFEVFAGSNK